MSTFLQPQTKTASKPSFTPVPSGLLQRKCACGGSPGLDGECEECRNKRLQRRAANGVEPTTVPPIVLEVLHSPGQPLDPTTRAFFEPRFGHDFSRVRVHTDVKAAESARAMNALAYTVGNDVIFGSSKYAPKAPVGRELLAHELTHTIQQDDGTQKYPEKLEMSKPEDAAEREAHFAANSIIAGESYSPVLETASKVARQQEQENPVTPCPITVRVGEVAQFNHGNLSDANKEVWRTYLGAVSRMDVGPGPDHSGHCMKESLTLISNNCPQAVYTRGGQETEPCAGDRCLDINSSGSAGDALTRSMLRDGPTSFLDLHRTRFRGSLLEGTGTNSCSVVCQQTYSCDRTHATTGVFRITRNYRASTFTKADGTSIHVTTGTVTKRAVDQRRRDRPTR